VVVDVRVRRDVVDVGRLGEREDAVVGESVASGVDDDREVVGGRQRVDGVVGAEDDAVGVAGGDAVRERVGGDAAGVERPVGVGDGGVVERVGEVGRGEDDGGFAGVDRVLDRHPDASARVDRVVGRPPRSRGALAGDGCGFGFTSTPSAPGS